MSTEALLPLPVRSPVMGTPLPAVAARPAESQSHARPLVMLALSLIAPMYILAGSLNATSQLPASSTLLPTLSPMAARINSAIDEVLDLSDAYLHLGGAYDLWNSTHTAAAAAAEHTQLLNNDHAPQHPAPIARAMYQKSLRAHDFAGTLANWLNTLGGQYQPNWSKSNAAILPSPPQHEKDDDNELTAGELDAIAGTLDGRLAALRRELRAAAVAAQDWPTLDFLRLAMRSTLHDPAPEKAPSAAELAELPNFATCDGFPKQPPATPPLCGAGAPLARLVDANASAAAVALVHSTLLSSRMGFGFATALDRTATALKGFEQWHAWRSRSDRANAMSLVHYLAARGVLVRPPAEPYDAAAVRIVGRGAPAAAHTILWRTWLRSSRSATTTIAAAEEEARRSVVDPAATMEHALTIETRKAALISEWYGAAANGQSDDECSDGADPSSCAFLSFRGLRWLRTGDQEDEPEWRETLLHSQARKLEDMRKVLTILKMGRAPERVDGQNAFGDYYVDHQLPDTVP